MSTANLNVEIKTDGARESLIRLKEMMRTELAGGIMVSVNAASLISSVQRAVESQRFNISVNDVLLKSQVFDAVKGALAFEHKVNFDASGLTADIKVAVAKGMAGASVGVSSSSPAGAMTSSAVEQLKSVMAQVLVPAVDKLVAAADRLGKVDRTTTQRSAGGALRASESASYVTEDGKRRGVTKTLDNPLAELKKAEEALAAKREADFLKKKLGVSTGLLDQRLAEIAATEKLAAKEEEQFGKKKLALSTGLLDQRLAEIAATEKLAAKEEEQFGKKKEGLAKALLDQRLAEIAATEKLAAKEEEQFGKKKAALTKALLDQRLAEIAATELAATNKLKADMKAHFNAVKFSASETQTSRSASGTAARSVASKFGDENAREMLGNNQHWLEAGTAAKKSAADHSFATKAMNDAHSASRGLAGSLGMLWATWGSTVPILAGAAIGSSMVSVFKIGKDVEYQLKFVSALAGGAAVDMEAFGAAVRGNMVMPGEAAQALRGLAQNGLSASEALQALPPILALATAGEMALGEAALGATGVMAAFSLTVNDLGRISDVFAKAASISNTSVTGMVEAMKQASTVADVYNVSLEETAAALAVMAKRNIEGSAAGTAYRNMWVELATPTKKAQDTLKQLGLQMYDNNKTLLSSDDAFKKLHNSLAVLNDESRAVVLNNLFGERGAKAANAILSDLDTYNETLKEIKENSKDFTKSVVDALNETVQGKTKALMAEFQLATMSAFDSSSASIKNFVDSLRSIVGTKEFVDTIKAMTEVVINLSRFLVDNAGKVALTLAAWKGVQYLVAARAAYLALAPAIVATEVAVVGLGVAARATMAALTGGLGLIVALGVEYFLFSEKTDKATEAQKNFNNTLGLNRKAQEASIESLKEQEALQRRIITLQLQGMTEVQARKMLEDKGEVKDLQAKLNGAREKLAKGQQSFDQKFGGDKKPGTTVGTLTGSTKEYLQRKKQLDEEKKGIAELEKSLKTASTEFDAKTSVSDNAFHSQRLDKIAGFKKAAQEASKLDKKIKVTDLIAKADAAPMAKEQFDKYYSELESAFSKRKNSLSVTPDKRSDRKAESERDKLRAAEDAEERALMAQRKAIAEGAVQTERGRIADLQSVNQQGYDSGKKSYEAYVRDREKLTLQAGQSQISEAKQLAEDLEASAVAKYAEYKYTDEKDPADRAKMRAVITDFETQAILARARAKKIEADVVNGTRDRKADVASNVHGTLQSAKDQYFDGLFPEQSAQAKLATTAARMKAEIEIYEVSAEEKMRLTKEVEDFVAISERKMASDAMANWANSLSGSLKEAADGFVLLTKGAEAYLATERNNSEQKDKFEQLRKENKGNETALGKIADMERDQAKASEKQQISSYAAMAGAGKKFFKEHTGGYKALQAAEQGLRTYQMVMSSKAMLEDVMNVGRRVATWIFGETSMTTTSVAASGVRSAATASEAAVAATAGVVAQSQGDPYSAFPRMAAMAAIMAGLGFATGAFGSSGSTSGIDSAKVQAAQGTGTVFGDKDAKSESLANALEHLEDMASPQLKFTMQMAASLRRIDNALTGVSGQILRTGGSLTGSGFEAIKTQNNAGILSRIQNNVVGKILGGTLEGALANKILGSFFGKTKSSLADSGLQFGAGSLGSILDGGISASSYQVVDTVKKKYFGLSKKTSSQTNYGGVDSSITSQMNTLVKEIYTSVSAAGMALGNSAQQMSDKLLGVNVDLGRISLKGLTGTQIQEQLSAVFGAFSDRLAAAGDSSVLEFQKVGEGYFETLLRVASGIEEAQSFTDKLGINLVKYTELINQQGDVSAELVRQSITTVEAASGISKIIDGMGGTASDLSDLYTELLGVRYMLQSFGAASVDVSSALIAGAGDLDTLAKGVSDYNDNFFTESERLANQTSNMAREFGKIGIAMPATNEAFRAYLTSIDGTTEAGQKLFGSLIALSGGFSSMTDAAKELEASKLEMQIALLKAMGKDEQALALERQKILEAMDPTLKAMQQQVWATEELAEKFKKLKDAGKSLSDFIDSLSGKAAATSTLASTRAAYVGNLGLARNDDAVALSKTVSVAQAYIDAAKNNAKTQAEYLSIVGQVKAELKSLHATQVYLTDLAATSLVTPAAASAVVDFSTYTAALAQGPAAASEAPAFSTPTQTQLDTIAEMVGMRVELKAANMAMATYLMEVTKILKRWDAEQEADTGTF
jgi:TP901 family phage tail tape measure protein